MSRYLHYSQLLKTPTLKCPVLLNLSGIFLFLLIHIKLFQRIKNNDGTFSFKCNQGSYLNVSAGESVWCNATSINLYSKISLNKAVSILGSLYGFYVFIGVIVLLGSWIFCGSNVEREKVWFFTISGNIRWRKKWYTLWKKNFLLLPLFGQEKNVREEWRKSLFKFLKRFFVSLYMHILHFFGGFEKVLISDSCGIFFNKRLTFCGPLNKGELDEGVMELARLSCNCGHIGVAVV